MNDQQLSDALTQLVADRKRVAPSDTLAKRVWAIPETTDQGRERLWPLPAWRVHAILFSTTKLAIAGLVLVFVLAGGTFLLAGRQPSVPSAQGDITASLSPVPTSASTITSPQPSLAASPEAPPPAPTFTGTFGMTSDDPLAPAGESNAWAFTSDMSDLRFAGDGQLTWTTGDAMAHVWLIENADGSWRSRPLETPVASFPAAGDVGPVVFDGAGAYRGLVAVVTMRHSGYGTQALQGSILPASEAPQTRPGILPGVELEVAKIRQGVFQVLGDGVRDLSAIPYWIVMQGDDGHIWLGGDEELSVQLGDQESGASVSWTHPAPPRSEWKKLGDWADGALRRGDATWLFALAADGRAGLPQTASATRLARFDGRRGRDCSLTGMPIGFHPVAVDASGGLWGTYPVEETTTSDRSSGEPVLVQDLALARFDCERWDADFPPFGVMVLPNRAVGIADDGTVWVLAMSPEAYIEGVQLPVAEQTAPHAFPRQLYVITPSAYLER